MAVVKLDNSQYQFFKRSLCDIKEAVTSTTDPTNPPNPNAADAINAWQEVCIDGARWFTTEVIVNGAIQRRWKSSPDGSIYTLPPVGTVSETPCSKICATCR